MTAVVVENFYSRRTDLAGVVRDVHDAKWCIELHHANPLFHSVTADGTRSLCVFDAPDAEAMRRVMSQVQPVPPPRIWAAATHFHPLDPDRDTALRRGETTYAIIDRSFPEAMKYQTVLEMADARSSCLIMYRARYLCSFLSLDGLRMACLYAGPDLEAVRMAIRLTGLPFDDILAATIH